MGGVQYPLALSALKRDPVMKKGLPDAG